ncbi:altered inheritance of mitochondria 5 domain-containing protein [Hirsutella rhossiliensis]|uniref:MICOS complex subunit MIC12 n=1 Tax=Hirsutella rhossiliensis TaxID=111463 RepID=A0A9P8SJL5_9HYPO|nr:altered inheritance of mitochondria 5 domain-containing protein [Hirsutella rhossiliensis]KAH0963845.1 altered inheritance of mitochondria 5 domain-containing protein [Hirsutella rhossiliensis]
MGFATGFTGGVTLTLSLAYLSVLAHQRNREEQSRSLRAQALTLQSIVSPIPQPLPPSRAEVAAAQRAASIESAKDRWNDEVENAVRWMQKTDWTGIREGLEARVATLWTKAFGEMAEEADRAGDKVEPLARTAKSTAGEAGNSISAAAKSAFGRAKEAGSRAESAVQGKALDAKIVGTRAIAEAEDEAKNTAAGAQGVIASALEKGRDKAQAMVGKVKTAVGMTEDEAAGTATEVVGGKEPNPVQRALQQRYERADAKVNRNVAEVLRERYMPMDQRDNTVLRGL